MNISELENVPTETKFNVETSMDMPLRVGILLLFLVFGVFGAWAAIAPLDGAAQAAGTVTVRSYSSIVQHLEGGIVDEIYVEDGDNVEANEPLLKIDDTQALAELEIANSQFVAYLVRESRLITERDGSDFVTYPDELDQNDLRAQEEIAAQNGIFGTRKASNDNSVEILEQRIEQLSSQVDGYEALRSSKEQLAASYADELTDTRELLAQGFSDITRLRELERNLANYQGEVAELTATISSTQVQIGETRLQINQQEREFQNEVAELLGETQTNLNDVVERISALSDVVARTVVRAPEEGVVTGMQFHTIGGVISSGTTIATIVPQGEELIIEARVSPVDIDRVALNQDAQIRFSTFGSTVPTIYGYVVNLSADSFTDEQLGTTYYLARVEVTPDGMEELGNLELMPGMPAEVFITTGSRTLLQYLFKPFSNAIARSLNED
ncbi:MAG: HlyD family type I secretion periplasmic adaptor subunit [Pseudomonadales bacterium]|nr:HlyD family type I secretion periplasmic adaptor subunit [Pseudomonadales bacterium]